MVILLRVYILKVVLNLVLIIIKSNYDFIVAELNM